MCACVSFECAFTPVRKTRASEKEERGTYSKCDRKCTPPSRILARSIFRTYSHLRKFDARTDFHLSSPSLLTPISFDPSHSLFSQDYHFGRFVPTLNSAVFYIFEGACNITQEIKINEIPSAFSSAEWIFVIS